MSRQNVSAREAYTRKKKKIWEPEKKNFSEVWPCVCVCVPLSLSPSLYLPTYELYYTVHCEIIWTCFCRSRAKLRHIHHRQLHTYMYIERESESWLSLNWNWLTNQFSQDLYGQLHNFSSLWSYFSHWDKNLLSSWVVGLIQMGFAVANFVRALHIRK